MKEDLQVSGHNDESGGGGQGMWSAVHPTSPCSHTYCRCEHHPLPTGDVRPVGAGFSSLQQLCLLSLALRSGPELGAKGQACGLTSGTVVAPVPLKCGC